MIPALILFAVVVVYRVVLGLAGGDNSWMPDFAPLAALALFGPRLFPRRLAFVLPLAILLASDLVLNAHFGVALVTGEMLVRYLALAVIALAGLRLSASSNPVALIGAALAGSLAFYLLTNTASWAGSAAYPKSPAGLWQALTVGLPGYPPTWMFFRNSLVSDLVFTVLFIVSIALARRPAGKRAPAAAVSTRA